MAPDNVMLISCLLVFVEITLVIDTFVHLEVLEYIFSE